ncbi:MAG: glycosyltransferase family 4 protein [Chloroflexi bacterium]|nr:glycosyltransferase family 4 protein [Chloroflexota bacterium]
MKLAVFSPLNPQRSGISDYMEELLPHLARRAEVHLVIDDYQPATPAVRERFPIINYRDFPEHDRRHQYDLVLYQMGNSPAHRYCYPFLSRYPGVTVLHDLVLHHLIAGMTLGQGDPGGYLREMAFAYGAEGESLARSVVRAEREPPFFAYPLSDRAVRASLGVIAHSAYVVNAVQWRCPEVPAVRVPMGIPLPPVRDAASLREQLGLPEDAFVVASFGEASPHKRLPEAVRAFAALHRNYPGARYVMVGNRVPALDLDALVASLGIAEAVRVTGYVTRDEFDAYLQAADVCINLRYPTAGETSASALRCMAAGKPVLVSDVGANRELPEGVCLKVPVDAGEQEAIISALERLREDRAERRTLGERAWEYVATHHTLEGAAAGYLRFARQILSGTAVPASWEPMERPQGAGVLAAAAGELAALGVDGADTALLREVATALRDIGMRTED